LTLHNTILPWTIQVKIRKVITSSCKGPLLISYNTSIAQVFRWRRFNLIQKIRLACAAKKKKNVNVLMKCWPDWKNWSIEMHSRDSLHRATHTRRTCDARLSEFFSSFLGEKILYNVFFSPNAESGTTSVLSLWKMQVQLRPRKRERERDEISDPRKSVLGPRVNFINILCATFSPIFWRQKIANKNVIR